MSFDGQGTLWKLARQGDCRVSLGTAVPSWLASLVSQAIDPDLGELALIGSQVLGKRVGDEKCFESTQSLLRILDGENHSRLGFEFVAEFYR